MHIEMNTQYNVPCHRYNLEVWMQRNKQTNYEDFILHDLLKKVNLDSKVS
jgi:hypothetical protein